MSRLKSTTFAGAPARIAGVDASILTRLVQNVAGDLALIYDKLTGENGETSTIDHSGGGRGAPIGMPVISQEVNRYVLQPNSHSGSKYEGETYALIGAFRVPDGQTSYVVEIDAVTGNLDTSDVVIYSIDPSTGDRTAQTHTIGRIDDEDQGALEAVTIRAFLNLSLGTAPTTAIVALSILPPVSNALGNAFRILRWRCFPATSATFNDIGGASSAGMGEVFDVATTINAVTGIDSIQVLDDGPLDAKVLVDLSRWLQAMTEYVMGGPLPGNEDRTVTQEWNHDGSVFASEPLPGLPIFCESLGAILADGTSAVTNTTPEVGSTDWFALHLHGSPSSPATVATKRIWLPDFDSSPSKLKALVLASSSTGSPTSWKAGVTGSTRANFAAVGGGLYLAEVSAIPFTPGDIQDVTLQIEPDAVPVTFDELNVLSWCLYFEA